MDESIAKLKELTNDLINTKSFFFEKLNKINSSIHIFTHLDADGLASGAILGRALYREKIPFQISILKQLEREEILKIKELSQEYNYFFIFSDFGSGQYLELINKLKSDDGLKSFIILDHHIPQNVSDKEDNSIFNIYNETKPWHINPYFYDIDGSTEISGAGLCYYFAKVLNEKNVNLSPIALIGATGDMQYQEPKKSFIGLNKLILNEAMQLDIIEMVNDLNFSPIKPLNEAIAYSSDINLPGLTGDPNKVLIFLQKLGILMENTNGNIKALADLNQSDKQKITSAIIRYISFKLDLDPNEILDKLIINRYILKNEIKASELHDLNGFSNLLNSCGRTDVGGLGIVVAMGDRGKAFQKALENLMIYKKSIVKALTWIHEKRNIQHKDYIQYFFGEDIIPEKIIGTISSMLIFEKSDLLDTSKPIFGFAKREEGNMYKVSARADKKLVNEGLNLSEVIREALELTNLETLGGGHPPAAGTKIPIDRVNDFLENCNKTVEKQLSK
ncbi:MAG: DHHA1 domain-containing protein [Promethearchaeota archaeon]